MTKLRLRFLLCLCAALLALGVMNPNPLVGQTTKKSDSSTGPQIDLNTASEKDLDSLPGVGPATAKKIIAGRPYSSVNDLSKAGISTATVKKIIPLVTAGGATAPSVKATTPPASMPASQPSSSVPSQSASQPAASPPAKAAASTAPPGNPGPGMVWVNLTSGVYHYSTSQFYGKTKTGKYMSEADAVKAGYHPAKNEKKPQ